MRKKVMIYGTLGPACSEFEILKDMFREGMDGIRLNLSHTTLDEAAELIARCQRAAEACGVRPELLIDMQGPELRVGALRQPLQLREEERIGIDELLLPEVVCEVLRERPAGQEVLLDDGKILLQTEDPGGTCTAEPSPGTPGQIMLRVVRGGVLRPRKSVALPGCQIRTPAMTTRDREQICRAKAYGVTAVMQPFVRSKEDLMEVRRVLDEADGSEIRLLAKIENRAGIETLSELIPHCNEIVIARGDLGNAMDLWELPAAQKRIAAACRMANRDFMVVTQMLDSMTTRQVPTRAEVSDIFNAVLDGAASVMVTGETAAGAYPALVIRYLTRTVRAAETYAKAGKASLCMRE